MAAAAKDVRAEGQIPFDGAMIAPGGIAVIDAAFETREILVENQVDDTGNRIGTP